MTAAETVPTEVPEKLSEIFERAACSRCGGTGRYSWCAMYGDRCFGCGGTGYRLTKRGAAARRFWEGLNRVPVESLRPGDRILADGYGWRMVEEVVENRTSGSVFVEDDPRLAERSEGANLVKPYEPGAPGRVVVYRGWNIRTRAKGGGLTLCGVEGDVKVAAPEFAPFVRALVAEYQASLTKAGKPRKGSRWDV